MWLRTMSFYQFCIVGIWLLFHILEGICGKLNDNWHEICAFPNYLQSDRLHQVLEHISEVHSLCGVLGLDFGQTVSDVHPSLERTSMEQATNISNSTLEGLEHTILTLKTERKTRIQKVSSCRSSLEIHFYLSFLLILEPASTCSWRTF